MKKETQDAIELALLKKDVADLKEAKKSWDLLVRNAVVKTVFWLLSVGIAGLMLGMQSPEAIRKSITEWLAK